MKDTVEPKLKVWRSKGLPAEVYRYVEGCPAKAYAPPPHLDHYLPAIDGCKESYMKSTKKSKREECAQVEVLESLVWEAKHCAASSITKAITIQLFVQLSVVAHGKRQEETINESKLMAEHAMLAMVRLRASGEYSSFRW
jgi:hypothetical protein